jgi:hypothetical protein
MVDMENVATKVLVAEGVVKTIAELLPDMYIAEQCAAKPMR